MSTTIRSKPKMSDEAQPERRRAFLNEPGESLLAAVPAQEAAQRFQQWLDTTGVPANFSVHSDLVANPLPLYPERFELGRRRWPGTRPESMWHPLMWLPPRVAGRYNVTAGDGDTGAPENDDMWAVRVALELTDTGLYDETTGTWVDILAQIGIDIDSPEGVERVQRWLDGAPDTDLDGIDLTPVMDNPADPAWAATVAAGWYEDLRILNWSRQADSLLESCDLITAAAGEQSLDDSITDTLNVLLLAVTSFHQLSDTEATWWADLAEPVSTATSVDEFVEGPLAAVIGRLTDIRERFWPQAEALANPEPAAVTNGDHGGDGPPPGETWD